MTERIVGRGHELARLLQALSLTTSGKPQVIFISGVAGAGKSSLLGAFAERAQTDQPDLVIATGNCNSQTGAGDPYLPFQDIVHQLSGHESAQQTAAPTSRLKRLGQISANVLVEYAPDLIGTLIPGSSLLVGVARKAAESAGLMEKLNGRFEAAAGGTATVDQNRIMESYTALLRQLAAHAPLAIVLDDLQWADAASCALLFHLAQSLGDARVLLVGTFRGNDVAMGRGGDRHPLTPVLNELKRYHGDILIDLDASGDAQRREFVAAIVDSEPNELDDRFRERLFQHTRGHALFTIELLRALQERGYLVKNERGAWLATEALDWSVLPSRVEGVIEERIGRLKDEMRELLRVASVEGESFTVDILARVGEIGERALLKTLSEELEKRHQLVTEGETEKIGRNWISHYRFGHALFQQYLYNQLGRREKLMLHGSVAELLEELYAGQLDLVIVQLAHHWRLAGEAEKAYDFTMEAGRRALRIGASAEALAHADTALELAADLPKPRRAQGESDAHVLRGHVFRATKGWAAEETNAAYERGYVAAAGLPPSPQLMLTMFGQWPLKIMRLELIDAAAVAEDLLRMAETLENDGAKVQSYQCLCVAWYWLGGLEFARQYARAALDRIDPNQIAGYVEQQGQDPRILPLRILCVAEAAMGNAEAGARHQEELLRCGSSAGHPFSLAVAESASAMYWFQERNAPMALQDARRAMETAKAANVPYYYGISAIVASWAAAVLGDPEGPARIEAAARAVFATGAIVYHSVYALMKSEVHGARGEWTEALAAADLGIQVAVEHDELVNICELHRVRAAALASLGRPDEARSSIAEGLEHARQQGAVLFERRAEALLAPAGAIVAN